MQHLTTEKKDQIRENCFLLSTQINGFTDTLVERERERDCYREMKGKKELKIIVKILELRIERPGKLHP